MFLNCFMRKNIILLFYLDFHGEGRYVCDFVRCQIRLVLVLEIATAQCDIIFNSCGFSGNTL